MKAKVGLWLFVGLVFDVVSMLRFAWVGVSSKNLFVVASVCLGVGLSSVPLSFRGGAMLVVNGVVDLFCGWLLWGSVGVVVVLWVVLRCPAFCDVRRVILFCVALCLDPPFHVAHS